LPAFGMLCINCLHRHQLQSWSFWDASYASSGHHL